MKQAWN